MSTWVKWTIAGLFAAFFLFPIFDRAFNPPLSDAEIRARESKIGLMNYYRTSCEAGNQIDCGKYEQIQKELSEDR